MTIYVDPSFTDDELRAQLFAGNLVVLDRVPAISDLVAYARDQLTQLFAPHDPEQAHEHYTPAQLAEMLGVWKPQFIHSDEANRLVRAVIEQAGFVPQHTYYDVPKPRTSFPAGHLNTGVAFAFPWHRDVWYSAPAQQINWWMPVFAARPDNAMSFDPHSFARAVPNDSDTFDYYQLNAQRGSLAQQVTREVQPRPKALDHHVDDELVVLPAPGGILMFSGAQLHTSIPNTSGRTRFSIDFRTVDARDLVSGRGAPLVDVHCTGTAIRDFHNLVDGRTFDEDLITEIFGAPPADAMLTFQPATAGSGAPNRS